MKGDEIIRRFEALKSQRYTVEQVWDQIERFVVPLHGGKFFQRQSSEHEIEWRRREVYDSTALEACQSLAASLHGSLTSPLVQWFELRFRSKELQKDAEASAWLEECSARVFQELQDSDFALEANETYIDLAAFGTSALVEEPAEGPEEWNGIDFTCVPIREVFFETDHKGRPINFYRRLEWTPTQIVSKFGDETPDDIRQKAEAAQSIDSKEELIFCVYKREGGTPWRGQALAEKQREYGFKYVLKRTGDEIGKEGGYYEMPAFLPRWRKTSGSVWGFSPAMTALSDILTLQQLVELILKATEKVIDPVMLANERDLLADLDLQAGTLNVVRDVNGMRPFESGARFDVSQLQRGELQAAIRRQFFVDQLELKESPAMTATEVQVRYEMMQRLLGPTLGRLQADYLDPCVVRTFNILWRAGQLPEMPESVAGAESQLDIEYVGPMPRAQKQDQVASIERFAMFVGQMAQLNPEVLGLLKWDDIVREAGNLLGVPSDTIKGEEEVRRERQAQAEAQAQQQQMMEAQAGAEIGATMAEGQLKTAQAGAIGAEAA